MAYTYAWDETYPTGNEDAEELDDIIRRYAVNIRQRMNTIIGNRWANAEPIVTFSHRESVHWSAGQLASGTRLVGTAGRTCSPPEGGNLVLLVPLRCHYGWTLTGFGWYGVAQGASTLMARLYRQTSDFSEQDEVTFFNTTGQGGYDGGWDTFSFPVGEGDTLFASIDMYRSPGMSCELIGVGLQYTRPDITFGG